MPRLFLSLLLGCLVSLPAMAQTPPRTANGKAAKASPPPSNANPNVFSNAPIPVEAPPPETSRLNDYTLDGAIESDEGKKIGFSAVKASNLDINPIPPATVERLNQLAAQHNYDGISAIFMAYTNQTNLKVSYEGSIRLWLENQAKAGNVIPMWMLSDRLGTQDPSASIYWSYAALFATWQERGVCTDAAVEFAADNLSRRYSKSLAARRANPWIIKQKMVEALTFLKETHYKGQFKDPTTWLCKHYADSRHGVNQPYVYDLKFWDLIRVRERNKIRRKLQIDLNHMEAEPAVAK